MQQPEISIHPLIGRLRSCGKVTSTYAYKYNDQGYVVSETATELGTDTLYRKSRGR